MKIRQINEPTSEMKGKESSQNKQASDKATDASTHNMDKAAKQGDKDRSVLADINDKAKKESK